MFLVADGLQRASDTVPRLGDEVDSSYSEKLLPAVKLRVEAAAAATPLEYLHQAEVEPAMAKVR